MNLWKPKSGYRTDAGSDSTLHNIKDESPMTDTLVKATAIDAMTAGI
jgi:hypothetical protein